MKNVDKKYQVIVIENSSDQKLKKEMEEKYENIHVEICEENLGFSKGMNLGIKLSKTQHVFLNPADVDISNYVLDSLVEIIKNFNDFGMLTPAYKDRSIHSNFFIWSKKGPDVEVDTNNKKFILKEVDFIDGTILLNKNIVKDNIFDENFFIYYEVMDLSRRLLSKNIKLYACPELEFEHFGGQSHDKVFNLKAKMSRNWHYNWSKFYFFKKHYNYFYALKKILPNLIRATKIYFKNLFSSSEENKNKKVLASYELKGIFAAIMLKKSQFKRKF
jgi:Predicted glycosyltransferases